MISLETIVWYILKRRDTTKILHDVLLLVDEGIPKTRIVYRANLSFNFSRRFFDFLLSEGYIAQASADGEAHHYKLTQKGRRLLHLLQQVEADLEKLFSPTKKSNLSSMWSEVHLSSADANDAC